MAARMSETADARLKRLSMRSWRRGTKEMDLILGPFADRHLAGMAEADLQLYDRLLQENDQDLMAWTFAQSTPPDWIGPLLDRIRAFARDRLTASQLPPQD
jgi:antitoxin CptB